MKTILLSMTFAIGFVAHSQLRVSNTGQVAVGGVTPNPWFNLTLSNSALEGIIQSRSGYYFRMGQSAGYAATIGTSGDRINFWYDPTVSYNVVKFQYYIEESDSASKENIKPLDSCMNYILQMRTYEYDYRDEAEHIDRKKSYGFLAQEMNGILPNLIDTANGVMGIKTSQITPFLVQGTQQLYYENQEQTLAIDSLNARINELEMLIMAQNRSTSTTNTANETGEDENLVDSETVLFQNRPNPFSENTVIEYRITQTFNSASIMIFDLNGKLITTHPLALDARGTITVEGGSLLPGMYIYSLIVDDVEVDTKKMILKS